MNPEFESKPEFEPEPRAVVDRYARRAVGDRYSMLKPDVWQTVQERQRAMLKLFAIQGWADLSALRCLEVGCGSGGNLLELLRLGFAPQHLSGVELLTDRLRHARHVLPAALALFVMRRSVISIPRRSSTNWSARSPRYASRALPTRTRRS